MNAVLSKYPPGTIADLYAEKLSPAVRFKDIDNYALDTLRVPKDNPDRVRAVNRLSLSNNISENSYIHKSVHLSFIKNHEVTEFAPYVVMVDGNYDRVSEESECVYVTSVSVFMTEKRVANLLKKKKDKSVILNVPEYTPSESDVTLTEDQRLAVNRCFTNGVSVITGGPGTGKTTVLRALSVMAEKAKIRIAFASFTGKAVRRMFEVIGGNPEDFSTIHRLLGYNGHQFAHTAESPRQGIDILVVDEVSMLGLFLFRTLLEGVSVQTKFVLVGDPDQLPSIETGNVLGDVIGSGTFVVTKFKEPFRQAEKSCIIRNAYKILRGQHDLVFPVKEGEQFVVHDEKASIPDMFFKACGHNDIPDAIINAYKFITNVYAPANFEEEVQVLTPNKEGTCGTHALNFRIRSYQRNEISPPDKMEIGDKIIFTRNNYDQGYMNGSMGINEASGIKIFDGKVVSRSSVKSDWEFGYAITVHKAQGSEFNYVIIPITNMQSFMMTRALLYTAVTRAKRGVFLIGEYDALHQFINNDRKLKRRTNLEACLRI